MNRIFGLLFVIIASGGLLNAQQVVGDSVKTTKESLSRDDYRPDTVMIKSYAKRYNPRTALLYAAVLPGLGQVYTKKYWKLPLVYGGMGACVYSINFYQKGYTKYKNLLFDYLNGQQVPYSEDALRNIINKARRERDFMIIIMGLVYVLQIVDAHVDAHLKEFDLNPNLHVRLEPLLENSPQLGRQSGGSLIIRF